MQLTQQQLLQILPNAGLQAGVFVSALNEAMTRYQINSPMRVAAFLAQIGHESAQLTRLAENLNYSARRIQEIGNASPENSRWRSLVPRAQELATNPEKLGNAVYGGRLGNDPEASGDGYLYRGRGLIQITGKANYIITGAALGLDLAAQPQLLEQAEPAALSAARFWSANGLNALADAGNISDIGSVINTGKPGHTPVGATERAQLYTAARKVLG